MTRLFDRQLAQPSTASLYDLLRTAQDEEGSTGAAARAMLANPHGARMARAVRPAGTGLLTDQAQGACVIAAEAVHRLASDADTPGLYARLRACSVLPQHEPTFVEVQKLRSLGPVTAFGWLVSARPVQDGYAAQAFLTTEWGRGNLFSPLTMCTFDLDRQGRYRCEAGTDGPATRFSFPDDPHRPGLLAQVLEPIARSLLPTIGTMLATLAVLNERPHVPQTVPDAAQSAAYRRRSGRALKPYHRIPSDAPALQRLFAELHNAP